MTGWLVHADGRDHRTELYDLEYPKGTDHRSDAHRPGTEEVIVCVQGRIRVGPVGEEAELGPGRRDPPSRPTPPTPYEALRDTRVLCWMLYAAGT